MARKYHSVYLDEDNCKGCTNCIKKCPTEAIRVRDGKASINKDFCIDCGECIRICPHHAKLSVHDPFDAINQFEYKVALPPPSLYAQFNNLENTSLVLNALLHIGFDDVFEVSAAAELVSEASRKYIAEHPEKLPFISTACPTVVRLISVRFPNLMPHLLPLKPPIEVAATLALKKALAVSKLPQNRIGIIFISPCPSKVSYVHEPLGTNSSNVNLVLSMKEVYPRLLSALKMVARTDYPDISASGKIGVSWGHRGGECSGLLNDNYLAADGIENVIKVLEDLEDQKLEGLEFVELNACNGGCVGGVLTVENPYVAETKLQRLRKYMPVSGSHINKESKKAIPWTKDVEYQPVFNLGKDMIESLSRMNQVERLLKKLPGLDCGSCGAPSCRILAEDIVKGLARENDCIYLYKSNIDKLTDQVNTLADNLKTDLNSDPDAVNVHEYIKQLSDSMVKLTHFNDTDEDKQ